MHAQVDALSARHPLASLRPQRPPHAVVPTSGDRRATPDADAKPASAGTPTPGQHHDHDELQQLPYQYHQEAPLIRYLRLLCA